MDTSTIKILALLFTASALISAALLRRATTWRSSGARDISGGREAMATAQKRIRTGKRSLRMSLLMWIVAIPMLYFTLRLLIIFLNS